jgi:hypothetical protein
MSSAEEILTKVDEMRKEMKALQKNLKALLKGKTTRKSSAKDGEKTPRAPTAWTSWTQNCPTAYAEEYAEYKQANKGVKGVAILFAKHCQTEHEDEHKDFVSEFEVAHPREKKAKKTAAAPKVVAESAEPVATPAKKKLIVKAAAAPATATPAPAPPAPKKKEAVPVKVSAKKPSQVKELFGSDSEDSSSDDDTASVASVASVASAPANAGAGKAEDEDEDAARLWTWKSKKYFRTSSNECWFANADGSMGKWAGVYDPIADSMDADVEEPEIETE